VHQNVLRKVDWLGENLNSIDLKFFSAVVCLTDI
jgi:hypothetical protein